MERSRFEVRPVSFEAIHELPDAWQLSDYRELLTALDFDDAEGVTDNELREMCLMALADLEPEDAAAAVLRHRLGTKLREGQVQDVSHDIVDEPLWEDYPDMRVHEQLYNVNQLLYDAFNGKFPRPRAVRLAIEVEAFDDDGGRMLSHPSEAFVVRLLASGADEEALIHRLFEDQLAGPSFPEAEFILWQIAHETVGHRRAKITMTGSGYWLAVMKDVGSFEALAHRDTGAPQDS